MTKWSLRSVYIFICNHLNISYTEELVILFEHFIQHMSYFQVKNSMRPFKILSHTDTNETSMRLKSCGKHI